MAASSGDADAASLAASLAKARLGSEDSLSSLPSMNSVGGAPAEAPLTTPHRGGEVAEEASGGDDFSDGSAWTSDTSTTSGVGRRARRSTPEALLLDRLPSPRTPGEPEREGAEGATPLARGLTRTLSSRRRNLSQLRRRRRELQALIENGTELERVEATAALPGVQQTLTRLYAELAEHQANELLPEAVE